MADPGYPIPFSWLRDWAAWILAGISMLVSSVAVLWRRTLDIEHHKEQLKSMHTENREILTDLSARLRSLEDRDRSVAIELTKLSSLAPSLDRIEDTLVRMEDRVNQIADRNPPRGVR